MQLRPSNLYIQGIKPLHLWESNLHIWGIIPLKDWASNLHILKIKPLQLRASNPHIQGNKPYNFRTSNLYIRGIKPLQLRVSKPAHSGLQTLSILELQTCTFRASNLTKDWAPYLHTQGTMPYSIPVIIPTKYRATYFCNSMHHTHTSQGTIPLPAYSPGTKYSGLHTLTIPDIIPTHYRHHTHTLHNMLLHSLTYLTCLPFQPPCLKTRYHNHQYRAPQPNKTEHITEHQTRTILGTRPVQTGNHIHTITTGATPAQPWTPYPHTHTPSGTKTHKIHTIPAQDTLLL